jgi:hypothetical protein
LIARADELLSSQPMPARLAASLTDGELRDLLAFLTSH